jgi:alginate O-acetyltransferase complex protein AlgI
MPFSSFTFLLLLPFFVVSFWLVPPRLQTVWLIFLSGIVYLAAGWWDLALLVAAVGSNWLAPNVFGTSRRVVTTMVVLDVLFLGVFKYRAFVGSWFTTAAPATLVIPLGISFYVFQLISYQVELGAGQIARRPKFKEFFLYIFFFAHHQAGPIMRPKAFLTCFVKPRSFYRSRLYTGLMIFLWGLFKKIWIADLVAPMVNSQFPRFHDLNGYFGNLWLLGVLYGIQIYGDFSGYSDMAVGMGRMFGYKFERNFHQPYLAGCPREFWNRWHITLSRWLRDMIYIPLGGNRGTGSRTAENLLAVMVIGGLWHGAGWNFLLWGLVHGILLIAWRYLPGTGLPKIMALLLFQAVIMLTWLPFREPDLGSLANAAARGSAWWGPGLLQALAWFSGLLLFSKLEDSLERRFVPLTRWVLRKPTPAFALCFGTALFLILINAGRTTLFIYQRF